MDPNHKEVRNFYNEVYYRDIEKSSTDQSSHYKRLAKRLGANQHCAILDVACGSGDWLNIVSNLGGNVAGIDISDRAIEVCKQRMPDGDFFCGPAEELPFKDSQFDIVTCLGSLEHFIDQKGAISEIVRVANDNAKILILVPNSGFLTYRLGLYRGTNQKDLKETILDIEQWKTMFQQSGLEIEDCWRDLHVFNKSWLMRKGVFNFPIRLLQAGLLTIWPISWQYQIYFLCRKTPK